MTEIELRALIDQSQQEGFRALFQQYQSYVYAIIWRRICTVAGKEDAEECVSDVFAEVFLHFDEIRTGALLGYLATLANRTAIDCYRRLTARKEDIPFDDAAIGQLDTGEDIAAASEANAQSRLLLEKIRSLGEPDATIILQKYFYDRTAAEIAATVHMQPVTVRVRLNRALKRLRALLTEEEITL